MTQLPLPLPRILSSRASRDLLHRLAGPHLLGLGTVPRVVMPRPASRRSLPGGDSLAALLEPFATHIYHHRIRALLARWGCVAFAVATVLALARLVGGGSLTALLPVGALVAGLAAGVVLCYFQRPGASEIARFLDQRLQLHEVLGTAVELEEGLCSPAAATSPVARGQQAHARAQLANTSPHWALPAPVLRQDLRVLALLAAAWTILMIAGSSRGASAPGASSALAARGVAIRHAAPSRPEAANPFAHFAGSVRTVSRPAGPPALPGTLHAAARSAASGAAHTASTGRAAGGSSTLSGTGERRPSAGLTRAGGPATPGQSGNLGTSPAGRQGTSPGGLQRTGGGSAPSVGDSRRLDPNASTNMGNAAPASPNGAGAPAPGASGRPGTMPGGAEGQMRSDATGKAGQGSTPSGSSGSPSSRGGGARGGAAGRRQAGRQPTGGGAPQGQQRATGRSPSPGGGQAAGAARGARSGRPPLGTDSAPQALSGQRSSRGDPMNPSDRYAAGQQGLDGAAMRRMPGTGGSAHVPGVHDLLPNLGDQNVSQNGMAFIINAHRAPGSTVAIGRANTLQPTGSPGGVIVANAPSAGASQPGTYVAPDTNDVTPDQRALVKAYFNQDTGAH